MGQLAVVDTIFQRLRRPRGTGLVVTLHCTRMAFSGDLAHILLVNVVDYDTRFTFQFGIESLRFCLSCGRCHGCLVLVRLDECLRRSNERIEWKHF
jgi:hypothetical protein